MVNYEMLAIERAEVQLAINRLIAMTRMTRPDPMSASRTLLHLVKLVRRHLAHAEPMVYATAAAARGGRHEAVAAASLNALAALKDEWCDYLYHWDASAITADWPRFADETRALLEPLNDRIRSELAILFSLAVHLGLMPATN